ncbi:MAG: VWA domain-containing protein [Thermoanaerobaculia bacterium]
MQAMRKHRRRLVILAAAALALGSLLLAVPGADAKGKKEVEREQLERLTAEHRAWLEEVALLITKEERATFLAIEKDYQRDAFIERFWKIRDPYPETGRNEFKDRWDARMREVRNTIGDVEDDRAVVLLLNGFPDGQVGIRCSGFYPAEVWYYERAETLGYEVLLLFYQRWGSKRYVLWNPMDGFGGLVKQGDASIARPTDINSIINSCPYEQAAALRAAIRFASQGGSLSFASVEAGIREAPEPASKEWVATFSSYTTEIPEEATTFSAELEIDYPARRQSRTIVQGILSVPVDEARIAEFGGHQSYNFVLTGEVLRDRKLFDSFRYRFNLPVEEITGDQVPMVFERFLRPGEYELALRLEDLNAKAFFGLRETLEVPLADDAPLAEPADDATRALLAEANAAIATGATTLRIVPPRTQLQTGMRRIDTLSTGDEIATVTFILDEKTILKKTAPPWNVELDFGSLPRMRTLVAVAHDASGREVARDELALNTGSQRFAIRLTEPRRGVRYRTSLRAEAEIDVPEGRVVERVEFYLNETLVATHYQPPFTQPILLGKEHELSYVRAVAYQPDGNATEDAVFINAPDYMENLNIQFVELFVAALDRDKRPVYELAQSDFSVFEDGQPQRPVRFELVSNLPIHAGILIDISASMDENLEIARNAALSFFEETIKPRDRATLITFNDHPNLEVKFTNDITKLAGGLAGLKAERGTALYDSLVFALYYFNGLKGQRALVLLSDGKDEHSRFTYEDTLEYARRAGVALYTIGLKLPKTQMEPRKRLGRLAAETGGRGFFVREPAELPAIYEAIQKELRSRYYLAYQSTNTEDDNDFRSIDVQVARNGVEAKTLRGYYP